MKISSINIFKTQSPQQKQYQGNHYSYPKNGMPLLRTLTQDTCSFSGKIPSLMTPTMEDLINKTKALDIMRFNILRLAEHDIPCPVCGHIMLSVQKYNAFEEKILSTTDTNKLLSYIGEYKKYLHPIERKMFSIFREKHAQNPDKTLHQILRDMLPVAEPKIVHEQTEVLSNIGLLSRDLPKEQQQKISAILQDTFSRILDPRETSRFSRRVFIDKLEQELINYSEIKKKFTKTELVKFYNLEELPKTYSKAELQEYIEAKGEELLFDKHTLLQYAPDTVQKIIEEATKLPTAYNNPNAFIVKYAKRNYKGYNPDQKIALRMLSNSLATIEHIKAHKLRGATTPENLALECACDNNRKGHQTILQQIIENPQMIFNYPSYISRLCEIHLMGKVEKGYITSQNRTFSENSYGILDADLRTLRTPKKKPRQRIDNDKTPTKAERREQRKLKLKNRKLKSKNKTK